MKNLYKSFHRLSGIKRRNFIKYASMAMGAGFFTACNNGNHSPSGRSSSTLIQTKEKLDKITFTINWVAEAEYGGFYQAVATGIYRDYGLDVTIKPGGPRSNFTLLLIGGAVDLAMGHTVNVISSVRDGVPKVTVASIFQKDPQVLIAHPGTGNDSLEKLRDKPIYVAAAADATYWPILKAKYGFTDAQKRPYNFDIKPFLADKTMIQQGIITAEPFEIKKRGGFDPVVMFVADYGYNVYNFTIETTTKLVETNPDLVQRFIDASIKGWYSYLEEPSPGNNLIKKDNPDMTDEQIAYSIEKIQEYRLITGGDAESLGIGAMTDKRWQIAFEELVKAGVFDANVNYRDAYTLQFVNKGTAYYKS
ncbi:ABC transporter substrate-binding protein [Scytonema sp. NUACC21]